MRPLVKIYYLRIMFGIIAAFICIGYVMATDLVSKNLVSNPSVELGTTTPQDWFLTGDGAEWSTTYARSGIRSIRINVTNSSAEWKSKVTEIQGRNTYTYPFQIVGFFRGNITKDSFFLSIRWFSDSQGLNLLKENQTSIPAGSYLQWSPIGEVVDAPSGVRSCEIVFKVVNGSGDVYGDNFEIRQTEYVPPIPAKLVNSISIALIVYLVSYYALKHVFAREVEKPQKIFTMGIGIYFFTWLVSLVLLYTLIIGLP
ncbi:hypothetical protein HXY33_08530 [Candidatus Bathyarchaeota archaeon]|nr:hypothetical protein [Candidatus Bathyarchaeota archaeon]